MRDPVITRWGNNFERLAILRAVKNNGQDPVAKRPIRDIRPGREISENSSLRRAIISKYGVLPGVENETSEFTAGLKARNDDDDDDDDPQ